MSYDNLATWDADEAILRGALRQSHAQRMETPNSNAPTFPAFAGKDGGVAEQRAMARTQAQPIV